MATTEQQQQQLLDYYSNASAEMQQKIYNAGNKDVKALIDNYNSQQGNTQTTPTTPTPTETTPTQTTPKAETPKTTTPDQDRQTFNYTDSDYYTLNSQARQDDIVNNLNNYRNTNPEFFSNYNTFKNSFSYNQRSNTQKQTLDTWRYGYDNARNLGNKSVNDLGTLYDSGQISDADLDTLKTYYPDKYNQFTKNRDSKNDMNKYSSMLYGTEGTSNTDIVDDRKNQFLNMLLGNRNTSALNFYDEYEAEVNTEEMTGWNDRLVDLDTEIKKIDSDLNSLYKDVERRYAGTGASKAKIQAIYADEAYDLQIQRNSLALEQQSLATKYNSRLQQAQQNFNMKVQQYELETKERNQMMNEMGFAMDLINFETNEQADERAWKNWTRQIDYQYGNINSEDETARRKAVDNAVSEILNQYSDIPMKRSKEQMIDDVMALVDGGMKLGEALTQNLIQPIQSKPEYVNWLNSKMGYETPVSYYYDQNGNLRLQGGSATVQTGEYTYSTIDNGNGTAVSTGQTLTINGQQYRITQLGGSRTGGIDFAPAVRGDKQEVQAFVGGNVIRSGTDKDTGNRYVEILGDDGYVYRYNHLNDWDGDVYGTGQRVEAGTVIGHMGETGKASGVHLDLAIYDGSRANSMSVSPLDIRDQCRVFFSSVQASGLGIGSYSEGAYGTALTRDNATLDQRRTYELAVKGLGETNAYWKSDKGIETTQYLKDYILANPGVSADDVIDDFREGQISGILKGEQTLYNAATSIFTDLYGANQKKEYNFLEQLENYVDGGDYTSAYEYVLKQLGGATSQSVSNTTKSDIDALKSTIGAIQDISDLYDNFLENGGSFRDLKEMYQKAVEGLPYTWEGDPQLTEITSRLQLAIANYIAFKSGKTVSEQEYARYASIFPTDLFARSSTKTKNQINSLLNALEDGLNINYRSALGPKQYNQLQDWYKSKTGKYYSFRTALGNYTNYGSQDYSIFSEDMLID